jgi:hypothetical protein
MEDFRDEMSGGRREELLGMVVARKDERKERKNLQREARSAA